MRTYEIRTSKRADADEIDQLRRAFARTATQYSASIDGVEVHADRGCISVEIRIWGSREDVRREGERAFAIAWYDAFGKRSSMHIGRLDGDVSHATAYG